MNAAQGSGFGMPRNDALQHRSDSAPDRIDAIRNQLTDDRDLAEVLGGREMRQNDLAHAT